MSGFLYLATPYSKYPDGIEAAYKLACREAGRFIALGIPVLSPIAHSHPIAMAAGLDPLDHGIWLQADEPLMAAACGLIVCKATGWNESVGIRAEIEAFNQVHKPEFFYDPEHYLTDALIELLRRNTKLRSAAV